MQNKIIIEKIRDFLEKERKQGKLLVNYRSDSNHTAFLNDFGIKVELNKFKEIILEEETGIELGGINKKSFSIIFPIEEAQLIESGKISLLGPEIDNGLGKNIDFGLMVLIGIENSTEKDINELRQLSFISDGIEGFSIRTIPRRFWCRISTSALQKGFSFEFLGNAIIFLYKQKFKSLIKKIEIVFINSYPGSIEKFITLSSEITNRFKEKWRKKIEEWKKRIGCDYDWGCEICPYQVECLDIKQVLVSREEIEK